MGDCVRFLAVNRAAVAGDLVCGHQPLKRGSCARAHLDPGEAVKQLSESVGARDQSSVISQPRNIEAKARTKHCSPHSRFSIPRSSVELVCRHFWKDTRSGF